MMSEFTVWAIIALTVGVICAYWAKKGIDEFFDSRKAKRQHRFELELVDRTNTEEMEAALHAVMDAQAIVKAANDKINSAYVGEVQQ